MLYLYDCINSIWNTEAVLNTAFTIVNRSTALIYTMFPVAPAAPFARNVAYLGIFVLSRSAMDETYIPCSLKFCCFFFFFFFCFFIFFLSICTFNIRISPLE